MLNDVQPNIEKVRSKMLVAMPHLADPRFYHTTLAMYKHDDEGAIGVIFNKPAKQLRQQDLFESMEIPLLPDMGDGPVYYGGPVSTNQVFVLHSTDYMDRDTLPVCQGVAVTSNRSILNAIANRTGPLKYKLCLGCALWGPKQLESELSGAWQHNEMSSWLFTSLTEEQVFSTRNLWQKSVEQYSKGVANNILDYMETKYAPANKS